MQMEQLEKIIATIQKRFNIPPTGNDTISEIGYVLDGLLAALGAHKREIAELKELVADIANKTATGYDFNADPESVTLKISKACKVC